MKIRFSYKAEDQLGRLPFDAQERIRDKIRFFEAQGNIFVFAKHIATEECYRFRVGKQRLKFIVANQIIYIVSIERRDKAY